MIWSICYSGLRKYEYFEEWGAVWKKHAHHIYLTKIPGKGNKGYDRPTLLPFPDITTKPRIQYRQFRRYLKRLQPLIKVPLDPYSFRYTFKRWCRYSLIPEISIDAYMGHVPLKPKELYDKYQVDKFFEEHNRMFREWVLKHRPIKVNPMADKFFTFTKGK